MLHRAKGEGICDQCPAIAPKWHLCHDLKTWSHVMKPVHWMGSSLKDIRAMPADVQDAFGHALYFAQIGHKHAGAKPLKGFRGAGVLEIVENHDGDTYRAVYTVRLVYAVYVLHACLCPLIRRKPEKPRRNSMIIDPAVQLRSASHPYDFFGLSAGGPDQRA